MTGGAILHSRGYAKISIHDPALRAPGADGQPRVSIGEVLCDATILPIPELAFGDVSMAGRPMLEHPDEGWRAAEIAHAALQTYVVHDAVVHGPEGVLTVGDAVITETLGNIPLDQIGCEQSDTHVVMPPSVVLPLETACYAMGGSHWNQYHWLIECLPRLRVPPFGPGAGPALLPPRTRPMQRAVEEILARAGTTVRSPFRGTALRVGALNYVPSLAGFGFGPHPRLADFFDALMRELDVSPDRPRRHLYLSRIDSKSRPLVNEAAVIALMRAHEFEIVALEGAALADQARLFAGASHIVAPHGAGLANLVFCPPGVSLCELHMDKYVHWAFRRLGGVRGVRYGCVIGQGARDPVEGWVHDIPWTVPIEAVAAAITDPRFQGDFWENT